MILWYDRQGKPLITYDMDVNRGAWLKEMGEVEKLLSDPEYKVVSQEFTPGRKYWISTVWLGLDQTLNFGNDPDYKPVIFETMVFSGRLSRRKDGYNYRRDFYQTRYNTEEQAIAGHKAIMEEWTQKEAEERTKRRGKAN